MDIALWLGRSRHAHTCFKSLPAGYETLDGFGPHHLCQERYPVLPKTITYSEKHVRSLKNSALHLDLIILLVLELPVLR